jgi:hypothetical protein
MTICSSYAFYGSRRSRTYGLSIKSGNADNQITAVLSFIEGHLQPFRPYRRLAASSFFRSAGLLMSIEVDEVLDGERFIAFPASPYNEDRRRLQSEIPAPTLAVPGE